MTIPIPLLVFFACWGSFLNVVSYRLLQGLSIIFPRSFCPSCSTPIFWYDNIPLLSWCLLRGKCRFCKEPISSLYPFLEVLSVVLFSLLYVNVTFAYFIPYFIFFSALLVSIRSDLEAMLISTAMTLGVIPFGCLASYAGYLPLTLTESIVGAFFGFSFLWIVSTLFTWRTGKKGLGEGDMDLLALIGAFTGPYGVWATLLLASSVGSAVGITLLLCNQVGTDTRIPFGPFLAFGAIFFVLYSKTLLTLLGAYIVI